MIKFFRKIRQKLLSENKFSKYLIYAFGEIILVVIGILIALGINNWNTHTQNLKKEQQLLLQLSSEIDDNIDRLKETIASHQKTTESLERILPYIHIDSSTISTIGAPFPNTILELLNGEFFRPKRTVRNTLISTGNIALIQSSELQFMISELLATENRYSWATDQTMKFIDNNSLPFLMDKTQILNNLFIVPGITENLEQQKSNFQSNNGKMLSNAYFENLVATKIILTNQTEREAKRLLKDYEKIRVKIKSELQ